MENELRAPATLLEAVRFFADPDVCIAYMAKARWGSIDAVTCPTCGSTKVHYLAARRLWQCNTKHPKRQFSVKVGTIFEDSPLGLDKWLPAVWMLTNAKNGISSYEIARALGITQKSAWFMLHRIRLAMQSRGLEKLRGRVEADETFIGGNVRNMHKARRDRVMKGGKGGGQTSKAIVMGLLERGGRVRAEVIGSTSKADVQPLVHQHVEPGAELMTDGGPAYAGLSRSFLHQFVDHVEAYVRGHVHINGIENFWSLLKRGLKGTYVNVEPFHLHRYVDEQAFRYNERKDVDGGRFVKVLRAVVGKRLTFAELTTSPA